MQKNNAHKTKQVNNDYSNGKSYNQCNTQVKSQEKEGNYKYGRWKNKTEKVIRIMIIFSILTPVPKIRSLH